MRSALVLTGFLLESAALATANRRETEYTITMRLIFSMPWRVPYVALTVGFVLSIASGLTHADNLSDAQRLFKQGQLQEALQKVDAQLASQPGDAQGRFLRGVILTEAARLTEAVAVFSSLSEDYPELPEPYNNLAVLYARQKQYDKARAALDMAIRTNPDYAMAYENLGDVYVKLAGEAYEKSLQLDAANKVVKTKLSMTNDLVNNASATAVRPAAAARPAGSR
jgi:tetratricopeptide (TPR) repeat protein